MGALSLSCKGVGAHGHRAPELQERGRWVSLRRWLRDGGSRSHLRTEVLQIWKKVEEPKRGEKKINEEKQKTNEENKKYGHYTHLTFLSTTGNCFAKRLTKTTLTLLVELLVD
jgi:hypothetical protein